MLKNLIARNKAAQALGIEIDGRRHWLSDGWPDTIPISALAKWQFPDNAAEQQALIATVISDIDAGKLPKHFAETDHYTADNPPLGAGDFVPWLITFGFNPCPHVQAWFEATEPRPFINDNGEARLPIEWLIKNDENLRELTEEERRKLERLTTM